VGYHIAKTGYIPVAIYEPVVISSFLPAKAGFLPSNVCCFVLLDAKLLLI